MAAHTSTATSDARHPIVRRGLLWGIPAALAATVLPATSAESAVDDQHLLDLERQLREQTAIVEASYEIFHTNDAVDRIRLDRPAALLYRDEDARFALPIPDETDDGTRVYRGKWLAEVALYAGWREDCSLLVDSGTQFGAMKVFGRQAEPGWDLRQQEIIEAANTHRQLVKKAEEKADTAGKWSVSASSTAFTNFATP